MNEIRIGEYYDLFDDEIDAVMKFTEAVANDCKKHGYRVDINEKMKTDLLYEADGYGGEFAFCQLFEKEFNWEVRPKTFSVDVVVDDIKIDVKQTRYATGALIVKEKHKHNDVVEVYALMTGTLATGYRYKGMLEQPLAVLGEKWFPVNSRYKNHEPVYATDQNELKEIDFLRV